MTTNNIKYSLSTGARKGRLMFACIFLFFILHSSFFTRTYAQAIGSWQIFPAYSCCTDNIVVGQRVYALAEHNLFAYDNEDGSVVTFDWEQQLNDVSIQLIRYNDEVKRIIIVYDNGNIDLLSTTDDNDVINLAQLKNNTAYTKTVNYIQISGPRAYLCTSFGIIVVNMEEQIIENTYQLGMNVRSCALSPTAIFAGTDSGLWTCALSDNLMDKSNWTLVKSDLRAERLEFFADRIWALAGRNLFVSNADVSSFSSLLSPMSSTPAFMKVSDGKLILSSSNKTYIFSAPDQYKELNGTFTWSALTTDGHLYWAADNYDGLQAYTLNGNTFEKAVSSIQPNSPLHNYGLHLRFAGDRLLVSGGNWNYADVSLPGTAMILEPDGTWINFDYNSVLEQAPAEKYIDVTSIAQDPKDENHHYVGTARSGIFEFRDAKCVGHIGLENSPLRSILPDVAKPQNFVSADGLIYDNDGNLWMLNCIETAGDSVIRIMRPDGSWLALPTKAELPEVTTADKIFFDSTGRVWVNCRRAGSRGIYQLDTNGTLDRPSDDRRFLRSTIVNQDGTVYSPDHFYDIAEDHQGQIWICTNIGPFLINNPDDFRSQSFTFEQVKVARNDGSGLADYLLSGLTTTCVAIDGANRKWFGSMNNGVYLISDDCQEEIYHFTTANSPMPSDNVYDIKVHPQTGRVFIATDKGVCAFLSDATEGEDELKKENIYAYPNPVDPDYSGPIVVRGLVENSEVKVVAPNGQLIVSGRSAGGTFTWNGCDRRGRRVASGVYTILANTPDGKKAASTKLTVIR